MKSRILALSAYPAPYRAELVDLFAERFDTDVFFETSSGDERENAWFSKGKYHLLDTKSGQEKYIEAKKNVSDYNIILFFEFSTKESVKLNLRCIFKKIPYAINCDGIMLTPHGNPLFDLIKKFLVSHASACLASGENAKQYFLKYGAKEDRIYTHTFSTLHEGDILSKSPDNSEKCALRKKLGLPEDKFISVAVGRFIELKRYNELICAFKDMPENHILLLIGSGAEEEKYRQTIKNNNIKNVIIEGFHLKEELFEYYKAADVFVHPTSYDVWGLVVNEAMACGLPVVSSNHCVAALELIENGKNGYKVPMGDDALMCERIKTIASDRRLCADMSSAALETIKDYTIDNMARTQLEVIGEILKNDNCQRG